MATVPTTHTVAVGDKVTASDENTYTRDPNVFWLAVPRVHAYASAAQTLTTATSTLITFDSEQYDSDTMHSTASNTGRLTAITAGMYAFNAKITYASNATSWRYIMVRKNAAGSAFGGTLISQDFITGLAVSNNSIWVNFDISLAANDYLEVFGSQNSGGNLNTVGGALITYAQMRWVASS